MFYVYSVLIVCNFKYEVSVTQFKRNNFKTYNGSSLFRIQSLWGNILNSGFKVHIKTITWNCRYQTHWHSWLIDGWDWAAFERNGVRNSSFLFNSVRPLNLSSLNHFSCPIFAFLLGLIPRYRPSPVLRISVYGRRPVPRASALVARRGRKCHPKRGLMSTVQFLFQNLIIIASSKCRTQKHGLTFGFEAAFT